MLLLCMQEEGPVGLQVPISTQQMFLIQGFGGEGWFLLFVGFFLIEKVLEVANSYVFWHICIN